MRIEDRIALGGCTSEESLFAIDHDVLVSAKSTGAQVLNSGGGEVKREGELYWFTLSTEHVNRRGDIIRQRGLDFTNWSKTPVVLHNHDDDLPVGMGTIKRKSGETLMGVQFSQANPRAQMLRAMLDEGMPMASSIAIMPTKVLDPPSAKERKELGLGPYGVVYERSEVIEGSIVTIPADPNAVRNALKAVEADEREVDRFVESLVATEMDLVRRLRADSSDGVGTSRDAEPVWLPRFEAALDRCAARIEQSVRGGGRREAAASSATPPSAASGIPLSDFLSDLCKEVDTRVARKD